MLEIISAKEKLSSLVEVKVSGRQGGSNISHLTLTPPSPRLFIEPMMNPYSLLWDNLMTTVLVTHSHFTDGETEAKRGSLPKGPSELLLDSRLKPALNSHTSYRRDSKGLCRAGSCCLGAWGRRASWVDGLRV